MSIAASILLVIALFTLLGLVALSTVARLMTSPSGATSRASDLDAPFAARETVSQNAG